MPLGRPRSIETIILIEALPGVKFYTGKSDKNIQALAYRHGRKVTTSKMVAFSRQGDVNAEEITLVTIVE